MYNWKGDIICKTKAIKSNWFYSKNFFYLLASRGKGVVRVNEKKEKSAEHSSPAWFLDIVFAARGGDDHHYFSDKVDDGRGRLFSFQLGKYVALVVRLAGRLPSDETEAAAEMETFWLDNLHWLIQNKNWLLWADGQAGLFTALHPAPIFRVQAAMGHGGHRVMSPDWQSQIHLKTSIKIV